jgi:hypothetical protein
MDASSLTGNHHSSRSSSKPCRSKKGQKSTRSLQKEYALRNQSRELAAGLVSKCSVPVAAIEVLEARNPNCHFPCFTILQVKLKIFPSVLKVYEL